MTKDQEFSHWQLPDVTEEPDTSISNLFGRVAAQPHKPEVSEEESVEPLTLAQLEEMSLAAEKEGFEAGKQEGYQQGLENGRLEGLEQGHKEGFEQGEQQGFEAGQARAQQVLEQLSQLVAQIEKPLQIVDAEVENELLSVAMALAKAVVCHEIQTKPEHILSVMRQGIAALPIKDQAVTIKVNMANAELISESYSEQQLTKNSWQIDIDPALGESDCIIESQRSSVDLSLEQRMNQVFSEMQSNLSQQHHQLHEYKAESNYQTVAKPSAEPPIQPSSEQAPQVQSPDYAEIEDVAAEGADTQDVEAHNGQGDVGDESTEADGAVPQADNLQAEPDVDSDSTKEAD
ncbi:flagellar assembly protein FliH [Shewanella sp. WXL01]|nr:flagellar assembly protein FliH [Shewanella sp. WXL01]